MKYQCLITDPCYLISHKDWQNLCDQASKAEKEQGRDWCEEFNKLVQNYLRTVSGDATAVVGNTGYGDWENRMLSNNSNVDIQQAVFVADSGMVCVVNETPGLRGYISRQKDHEDEKDTLLSLVNCGSLAVISSDAPLHGEIDETNSQWSVVSVLDSSDRVVADSLQWEEDEEEEYEEEN